jgi:hypothetical protein
MRKLGILAVAGLSSLVLAGAASADTIVPVTLSFNNLVLKTAVGSLAVVNSSTVPLTATANVDETPGPNAGTFFIKPTDVSVPTANFTEMGLSGSIQVALASLATGGLDPTTGQLVLNAAWMATVNVNGLGGCTATTPVETYSTDNPNVFGGKRFPVTAIPGAGFASGPGAIAGGWTSLAGTPTGSACAVLGAALGAGDIWISKGINPPPTLAAKSPTSAKLTAPKSVKVTVAVTDSGVGAASNVNVCVSVPKALKVRGPKCQMVATIAAAGSTNVTFTFLASPKAKSGSYKATFTATSGSVTSGPTSTTIKLKAKPKPKAKKH